MVLTKEQFQARYQITQFCRQCHKVTYWGCIESEVRTTPNGQERPMACTIKCGSCNRREAV